MVTRVVAVSPNSSLQGTWRIKPRESPEVER